MVEPQTVQDVMKRLEKEGYTEDFKANADGLRAIARKIVVDPKDIIVDKIYRFEGETNLDDEEVIFVLSCAKHNIKGTYLVAFGPKMDPSDIAIVHRLKGELKKPKS